MSELYQKSLLKLELNYTNITISEKCKLTDIYFFTFPIPLIFIQRLDKRELLQYINR